MKSKPDDKVVYLALKNLFEGRNTEVRRLKVISRIITDAERQDAAVSNLVNTYSVKAVSQVAQDLLLAGAFKSTLVTGTRSPDIVDISLAQDSISQVDDSGAESFDTCCNSNSSMSRLRRSGIRPQSSVRFPMRAQGLILAHVQWLLEGACFDFGRRAMPEVLEMRQWDCPDVVELNSWISEFRLHQSELFGSPGDIERPHDQLLSSLVNLRHTAVHRIRINVQSLESFLLNSEKFTALLGDATRREMLTKLRLNTQQVIGKLECHQRVLNCKRAELDRIREMGIAELEREESEYKASAVKDLVEFLTPSAALTPVVTVKEDETSLEVNEVDLMGDDNTSSRSDQCA